MNGRKYNYEVTPIRKNLLNIVINDQIRKQEYFVDQNTVHIFNNKGDQIGFKFETDSLPEADTSSSKEINLKSPMPGTITQISCKVGDTFDKNVTIIIMESMKM